MSGTGIQIVEDSGWILPTLATDVTITATGGRKHLGYRKYRGRVEVAVALDVANPAAGKLLFTLPVGFRQGTAITTHNATSISMTASAILRMDGDGTFKTATSLAGILLDITYIPTA